MSFLRTGTSYHANIGTFYVHRWLKSPEEKKSKQDLIDGRDHIDEALKINPDAHFGREWAQQDAIAWILSSLNMQDEWEKKKETEDRGRRAFRKYILLLQGRLQSQCIRSCRND